MRALVINNDSDTWQELVNTVEAAGHETTTISYKDITPGISSRFDAVILSGGWWFDDEIELLKNYAEELNLINTSTTPVLGICIGMQLMHVALDRAVPLLDTPQSGFKPVMITSRGQELLGFPEEIEVFKNHTRGVIEVDPIFEVLALSPGHVEIIKHRTRPLIGVQFHPEVDEIQVGAQLINRLLATVARTEAIG